MRHRRYPSDTTNAEWALIEPLLPTPACETSAGGRPEKHPAERLSTPSATSWILAANGGPCLRIFRPGAQFGASVRREALRCIPDSLGSNLEDCFWVT